MKTWVAAVVFAVCVTGTIAGCLFLNSKYGDRVLKVAAVPQIEGDQHTIWTEQTLGHTVCTDGKAHLLVMGLRHDGSVVWRIGPEMVVEKASSSK